MLLGDKKVRHSLTMVGAALFALAQSAEALGEIPEGTATQGLAVIQGLGALLAAFGIRRAVGENGLKAPFIEAEVLEAVEVDPEAS